MNKKRSPSVLVTSSDKDFSYLDKVLQKQNVELRSSTTKDKFIENLRQDFFNLAIIDTTPKDFSSAELITVIKSISPKTDIIAITAPANDGNSKNEFDNPLDNLVYAYLETPVNSKYLATLTLKALEKQKLTDAVQKTSQSRLKSYIESGKSGAESRLLSSSVNSLNSAVMVTDMNRDILYINKAHVRTLAIRWRNCVN